MPVNVKPSSPPARWAVTAGGTPAANISTPPSGQMDTGWTTGQVPPSAWQNFWQYWTYVWLLFVSYLFTDGGQAAGNMDLGATAEANLVPLAKYRDYQQNVRSHVDHNGYRMGQVSEIDENWRHASPTTLMFSPLGVGSTTLGGTSATSFFASTDGNYTAAWKMSADDTLYIPLHSIPVGAIITSITVYWKNAFSSQTVTGTLYKGDPTSAGVATSVVSKTNALATAAGSFDIMSSPTTGHGPKVVNTGETLALQIDAAHTNTNPVGVFGVQVVYYTVPVGWSWSGLASELFAGAAWYNLDSVQLIDAYGAGQGYNNTLINQRVVKLTTNAIVGVSDGESKLLSTFDTGFNADTAVAMEYIVATDQVTDGTDAAIFELGLKWQAGTHVVSLYWQHGFTDWKLRHLNGAGFSNTNTGVAVTASTAYRVRLELYGANRNSSGHAQSKLYINGALVATQTDSSDALPVATPICAMFDARTNAAGAGAGPYGFQVGRVRRVWNHLASGDNL